MHTQTFLRLSGLVAGVVAVPSTCALVMEVQVWMAGLRMADNASRLYKLVVCRCCVPARSSRQHSFGNLNAISFDKGDICH